MRFRFLWPSIAVASLACGSSTTSNTGAGGAGGMNDGKFHPPPNGVHTTEQTACSELTTALSAKGAQLQMGGCVGTAPICPQFVRVQSGLTCVEYDEGSVQGCISYYDMATSCADLGKIGRAHV